MAEETVRAPSTSRFPEETVTVVEAAPPAITTVPVPLPMVKVFAPLVFSTIGAAKVACVVVVVPEVTSCATAVVPPGSSSNWSLLLAYD